MRYSAPHAHRARRRRSAALDSGGGTLAAAKFPVILSGGGVIMSGGTAEAIALAELLGAPVVNSYLHNDSFPARIRCGSARSATRARRRR